MMSPYVYTGRMYYHYNSAYSERDRAEQCWSSIPKHVEDVGTSWNIPEYSRALRRHVGDADTVLGNISVSFGDLTHLPGLL